MENKIVKIAVITIALIFIGIIFVVVNSIFGNPISAAIATSRIQEYVQQNYPGQDYEIPKARYNFKISSYVSVVKSRSSRDTYFAVNWSGGRIGDNYEHEVANKFTTFRRLQSEFDGVVDGIINTEYPYSASLINADLFKSDGDFSALQLNMPLDIHNPPLPTTLTVWISSEELSYEILADRLLELHQLMLRRGIPFESYTLCLSQPMDDKKEDKPKDELGVYYYPADEIIEEGLAQAIKVHQEEFERQGNRTK